MALTANTDGNMAHANTDGNMALNANIHSQSQC